ncbi:hypothetical protein sscle_01g004750 [Sclerotinia sclerotiorum 1980 UF-70]|uniref:Ketoreductase (KR) domain-containing protein n=1 Tax=Sclerotinia sclerotiorum (strain ATCC 18683 / 1980 / Ss-1) TaxID=665079 RepID=A0A1D9PSK3_SCLS1|nr:hypothetical protein sscle_01g004750 [Sclerotinia sclerotiorum 1980 UF-70]
MASTKPLVLIIGGTGVQGMPVVKELAQDGAYNIRLITRHANSQHAQELVQLPGVARMRLSTPTVVLLAKNLKSIGDPIL